MEESFMLEWGVNSPDQILDPFQQTDQIKNSGIFQDPHSISDCCMHFTTNTPPVIDLTQNNRFSFLEKAVVDRGNNSWNRYCHSKSTDLNFGGTGDLNLTSHDLSKRFEAFGSKKQQRIKINSKMFVPTDTQDHVIAERKRREKLNKYFIELSSIIPYLKKTDKVSILIDAVKYVKELEEKVKTLEALNPNRIESAMLVKSSSCLSSQAADHDCSSSTKPKPLPEIEAHISGNNILISIHCESFKGVLIKILSQLEDLNFIITHTNLMPFSGTAFITITAQIAEGSSIAVEDVVKKLSLALNELKSRKN